MRIFWLKCWVDHRENCSFNLSRKSFLHRSIPPQKKLNSFDSKIWISILKAEPLPVPPVRKETPAHRVLEKRGSIPWCLQFISFCRGMAYFTWITTDCYVWTSIRSKYAMNVSLILEFYSPIACSETGVAGQSGESKAGGEYDLDHGTAGANRWES